MTWIRGDEHPVYGLVISVDNNYIVFEDEVMVAKDEVENAYKFYMGAAGTCNKYAVLSSLPAETLDSIEGATYAVNQEFAHTYGDTGG